MGVIHGLPDMTKLNTDVPSQMVNFGYASDHSGVSYQQIAESILTGAATDITFSNIPQTYRELRIDFALRSNLAGQKYDDFYVQVNGDAAGNYDWVDLKVLSSSVQGFTTIAGGACLIGSVPAALAPAGKAAMGRIRFPDYARTA